MKICYIFGTFRTPFRSGVWIPRLYCLWQFAHTASRSLLRKSPIRRPRLPRYAAEKLASTAFSPRGFLYLIERTLMVAIYPTIYCPLCKCDLNAVQSYHFLLEEGIEDGCGTKEPVLRHYTEILHLSEDERSQETTVHDYCWLILERICRQDYFDQPWFNRFKKYLRYLFPFMTEAPFPEEVHSLDLDVFAVLKSACRKKEVRNRLTICLPPEIIQWIYRFFDEEEDIVNLNDVLYIGPCEEQWSELGYKYMLEDDLDPKVNIRTLIRNLQRKPPDRYPKTTNYRIIWRNIELLLTAMQNPLVVENLSLNAPVPHHVQHGDGPDCVRYAVRLHTRLHMIFLFKNFGDLEILCGIAFNGQLVGHEGPIWKPVQVTSLKGFKVVTVEKHFVGIQIKDGSGWQLT